MASAAFIVRYPYVAALACYREPIRYLAERGWTVDVYTELSRQHLPPEFIGKNVRVISVNLTRLKTFEMVVRLVCRRPRYDHLVAVPGWGLHYGSLASRLSGIPMICLSDELTAQSECRSADARKWKAREIAAHQKCEFTIALSPERADFIRNDNRLPADHEFFIVPNATPGPARRRPSNYFQGLLGIAPERTILLHAGSWWWRSDFSDLPSVAARWKNRAALVFHGRSIDPSPSEPVSSENVFFSRQPLPPDALDQAVSSAHIGLALYDANSVNHRLIGTASGKIPLYMKNGLPVIATYQPSFEWIEKEGCGVLVRGISEIEAAVDKIRERYAEMSSSVIRLYGERLDFNRFFGPVYDRMNAFAHKKSGGV